eukprot:CAMPEP_0194342504 /NCGR_PEP_ID=MMETSP0171-20130528/93129_1 /TAXON_ID=218684 /ORGANISM="Corethron pennatum, Strain L29A3" /LENGTH=41 /DNA_ID= /DNA_START= /DNA_END= /DNA_ORIENTATION=
MRTNTIKVVDEEDIDVGDDANADVVGAVAGEAVVAAEVVGA